MASRDGRGSTGTSTARSVAEATRFTSNTPHASTKPATASSPAAAAAMPSARAANSPANASRPAPSAPRPLPSSSSAAPANAAHRPETLDEKVRRLRAAHLAAKNHDVSRLDRVLGVSRRYLDAAHRFTVMGLIGFSGLALVVSAYATVDMMMYNRKRRNEFFSMQKDLQSDSLEAARLAYMSGMASEDQIRMVEDATERAKQAGMSLPPLLPPGGGGGGSSSSTAPVESTPRSLWPGEAMQETPLSGAGESAAPAQKKKGFREWLFGGLNKEDTAAGAVRDDAAAVAVSGRDTTQQGSAVLRAVEGQAEALKGKAKAALDAEKNNQRQGGPLDQLGLDRQDKKQKGWLW